LRYALRFSGVLLIVLSGLWLLANVIITLKKESLQELVIRQIKKQVSGEIQIGDLRPDYFRTFPNISIRLTDVSLTDSMGTLNHHDFFKAKKIYTRIQILSLLKGKPKIGQVIVENGLINMYTDSCGVCNINPKYTVRSDKSDSDIPELTFRNTRFIIENAGTSSYHDIQARYLDCEFDKKGDILKIEVDMNVLMHGIGFNTRRGSYLKNKNVVGEFTLLSYPGKKMEFKEILLKIDKHPFVLSGDIFYTDTMSYDLKIESKKMVYKDGVSLLTESLQEKLDSFNISNPLDVSATIAGRMAPKVVPNITTYFTVNDSQMETTFGQLENCTFNGSFSNHADTVLLPGDMNSKFIFNDVYGTWSGIQVTSPRIEISNLLHPFLNCDIRSVFDLTHLNEMTESSTIRFEQGVGNLEINYHGSLVNHDTINPIANGTLSLNNAAFTYLPRNLLFENCTGVLEFKNEDLIIPQLSATAGNTSLMMSGNVTNLLALIDINPEQLTMEWKISTPDLNLNDFISYVAPKAVTVKKSARKSKLIKATENIDRLLSDGIADINITADKVTYKKFVATDVGASLRMIGNQIVLHDANLKHAGGFASIKGTLTNGHNSNLVNIESTIKNVDIPGIFRAFDNFGQDAITFSNMKGQMSAKIRASVALTDRASIVENSMKGIVDFSVRNGELNNFEPAMKIAATAFKKRDFSKILFAELDNHLEIKGSAIIIDKMDIVSNVVILFVEGVYDTKKGTDMSIQIPLSNLSREENDILDNNDAKSGVNIRLRAKTQEDGKLKVTWDPFNKASRERNAEI